MSDVKMPEKTDFKIDLTEGLKNPELAEKVVKEIQDCIDNLVVVIQGQQLQLQENVKLLDQCAQDIQKYQDATIDFGTSLKNIHTLLNANAEIVDQSADLKKLRSDLSKLILEGSMIKLGVIGTGLKNE